MADNLEDARRDIEHFIEFSYGATQDLKSPIQNLNSLLTMMEDKNLNEETSKPIIRECDPFGKPNE